MPTLEARGVELSWSEIGSGNTVLLVHETATSSGRGSRSRRRSRKTPGP